jgi:hypothetical protein
MPGSKIATIVFFIAFFLAGCGGGSDPQAPATPEIPNQPPQLTVESNFSFNENENVSVTAEASDPDGSISSTRWAQNSGESVSFDATSGTLRFTAPEVPIEGSQLIFAFSATDNNESTTTIIVTIDIVNINKPPIIVVSDTLTFNERENALVNITPSDPDGEVSETVFLQLSGTEVEVNADLNGDGIAISFTAPEVGVNGEVLEFEYTATDNEGASTTVVISINIINVNRAPFAIVGDDISVFLGSAAEVSASNSFDPDGDIITFEWAVTGPEGSTTVIEPTTNAITSLVPDIAGEYEATVTVTDPEGLTDTASITVTALVGNLPPIARITGQATNNTGSIIELSGLNSSDPENASLTYTWSLVSPETSAAFLSSTTNELISFTADVDGQYIIQLIVNDGELNSQTETFTVNTTTLNSAPIADAGENARYPKDTLVTLDGSASSDIDGDTLSYSWSLISRPGGSTAILSDRLTTNPTLTPNVVGDYVFRLTVTDGTEVTEANVTITVFLAELVLCYPVATASNSDCEISRYGWPFTGEAINPRITTTGTFYELALYRIKAIGRDYTMRLSIEDRNNIVTPFFTGIEDGQIIRDGESFNFTANMPLTNGQEADILLTIQREGFPEIHSYIFRYTTN